MREARSRPLERTRQLPSRLRHGQLQPPYQGTIAYGERAEHCWNGDPKLPNAYSRLHYNFQYLPMILKRMADSAPAGADLKSWRY